MRKVLSIIPSGTSPAWRKVNLLGSICLLLLLHSCYYDKADTLYPTKAGTSGACDSAGVVTYSQKIIPILQTACYSCHSISNPSGGIVMATYASDRAIALNGKLYGSISHASGYSPMPKGMAKLTNCQLATIKKWIDAGALNN
jgi:hypothetical protein